MPSDPGRPFTQQPSKSYWFIFTFPKKYWERKDEIISGQKLPWEEHVTVTECRSYRQQSRTVLTFLGQVCGNPAEELDLSTKVSSFYLSWLLSLIKRIAVMDCTGKKNDYLVYKEKRFYTYVVVYLFHLFHQCPQRRESHLFFSDINPHEWRKKTKQSVSVCLESLSWLHHEPMRWCSLVFIINAVNWKLVGSNPHTKQSMKH